MNLLIIISIVLLVILALPFTLYVGLYFWLQPEGSPSRKKFIEQSVSIVLPTYNEERIVEGKLEELCSLAYPMQHVEIVVVDSSDDETPDLVENFFTDREYPTLKLIKETERRGLAPALNDAYDAADNDIVVKTDCDSRIGDDALREAVANLADPDVAAVTGRNSEILGGSAVEKNYRDIQAQIQMLESHLDSTLIFHGPFSAFEANAILPLDPNSLADDTELALKIRRSGSRVVFDPAIKYKEAAHSNFRKRRKQKDRRGVGLIRLLFQHRDALGRYGNYGKVILPFNWWFMIVSPWLLTISLIVGVGGIISLAGLIGFVVPIVLGGFVWLGQNDALGPLQAPYSIFDTQVSLLRASVEALHGRSDGTWEIDSELREAYE